VLDVHRVSLARITRTEEISGLRRKESGRWAIVDLDALQEWVRIYKSRASRRTRRLCSTEEFRQSQRKAVERFQQRWGIPALPDQSVPCTDDSGDFMTTTELARHLGVSTQTVRNLHPRIPGAYLVGQRLRIRRSEKLDRWIAEYIRPIPKGRRNRSLKGQMELGLQGFFGWRYSGGGVLRSVDFSPANSPLDQPAEPICTRRDSNTQPSDP
jgi:hypothetical protein